MLTKRRKDNKPISSSRIRELIGQGKLSKVKPLLGRHYFLKGKVVRGKGVGRELGFPTANLNSSNYCLPSCGVYSAYAAVNGKVYLAAVNLGLRPTLTKSRKPLMILSLPYF